MQENITSSMIDPMNEITELFTVNTSYLKQFDTNPSMNLINEIRINQGKCIVLYHDMINKSVPHGNSINRTGQSNDYYTKLSTCHNIITLMDDQIAKCDDSLRGDYASSPGSMENSSYTSAPITLKSRSKTIFTEAESKSNSGTGKGVTFNIPISEVPSMNSSNTDQLYNQIINGINQITPDKSGGKNKSHRGWQGGQGTQGSITPSLLNSLNTRSTNNRSATAAASIDPSIPTLLLVHGKSWCGASKNYCDTLWNPLKKQVFTKYNILELEIQRSGNSKDVDDILHTLGVVKTVPTLFYFNKDKVVVVNARSLDKILSEIK